MPPQRSLGQLEESILAAILRLDNETHGVAILDEIERLTHRRVGSGALSVTLDRLERKGFVTSALSSPEAGRGGRPRRIVRVTPEGIVAAKESREAKLALWRGLEATFDDV